MRPLYAILVVAGALTVFVWASREAKPKIVGTFQAPPLYGRWQHAFSALAWWTVPAALGLAALAWWFAGNWVRRRSAALAATVVLGLAAAAAVGVVRGRPADLTDGLATSQKSPYNTADLHFVAKLGIHGLFKHYTELTFRSIHNATHPPGTLAMLDVLFRVLGDHRLVIATTLAAFSMCAALSAYWLGQIFGGARAGLLGAVLFVAAAGPLTFAYTSMDTVYATLLSAAVAVFSASIVRRSWRLAAAGGALLSLTTVLTFATVFVALAAAVAIVVGVGETRTSVRLLGAATGAGLVTLVVLRYVLDFDPIRLYRHLAGVDVPYQPYWIAASPVALWIYAGAAVATLGTAGLFMVAGASRRLILPVVLMLGMFLWAALPPAVTHLRPGETERTWAFLYPVLAAGAGYVIDRWLPPDQRRSRWIIAGLVTFSIAQAVLIQALWFNYF